MNGSPSMRFLCDCKEDSLVFSCAPGYLPSRVSTKEHRPIYEQLTKRLLNFFKINHCQFCQFFPDRRPLYARFITRLVDLVRGKTYFSSIHQKDKQQVHEQLTKRLVEVFSSRVYQPWSPLKVDHESQSEYESRCKALREGNQSRTFIILVKKDSRTKRLSTIKILPKQFFESSNQQLSKDLNSENANHLMYKAAYVVVEKRLSCIPHPNPTTKNQAFREQCLVYPLEIGIQSIIYKKFDEFIEIYNQSTPTKIRNLQKLIPKQQEIHHLILYTIQQACAQIRQHVNASGYDAHQLSTIVKRPN